MVHTLIDNLPITEARLTDIQQATSQDSQLRWLRQMIDCGWPLSVVTIKYHYYVSRAS